MPQGRPIGGNQGAYAALDQILAQRMAEAEMARRAQMEAREQERADHELGLRGANLGLQEAEFRHRQEMDNRPAPPPEPPRPTTMGPGQSLVDPSTGRIIQAIPDREPPPQAPERPVTLSPGAALVEPSTGRLIRQMPERQPQAQPDTSAADLATFEAKEKIKAKYAGSRPSLGAERQTLSYYNRAKQATDDITPLEEGVAGAGFLRDLQLQYAPGFAQTPEQQRYRQAQRAFTEARLRKESGAAIPTAEYENDARTYFAQPNDDAATLAQKRRARAVVLEGMKNAAGKAYEEFYGKDQEQEFDFVPGKGLVPR